MKTCCYCNETFPDDACRPYGVDGRDTCFPCGMKPENRATSDAMLQAAIDSAIELGRGNVYIGHHSGPLPMPSGEDSN